MVDYYTKAVEYDDDWEYEKAINECNKGIENNDYRCAYLLGIIYLEHLDEPNVKEAKLAFEKGAKKNNLDCKYELARILNGKKYEEYYDYNLSLEYYLETQLFENDDIDVIIDFIDKVSKDNKLGKKDNSLEFIIKCDNWKKKTKKESKNKKIINKLSLVITEHLKFLYNDAFNKSKSIFELDNNFAFLEKLKTIDGFDDIWIKYEKERIGLFLQSCNSIVDALGYRLHYDFSNDQSILNSIYKELYIWIVKSYKNNKYKSREILTIYDIVKYYNILAKDNYYYHKEKNELLKEALINIIWDNLPEINQKYKNLMNLLDDQNIKDEVENEMFDCAASLVEAEGDYFSGRVALRLIENPNIKEKLKNFILKDKFMVLKNYEQSKSSIMLVKLIFCYKNGLGTAKNNDKAVEVAFHFLETNYKKSEFNIVFYCFKDDEEMLKHILISGKTHNISFTDNQKEKYNTLCGRRLLIFDLDGTVFDTDYLRIERTISNVIGSELMNVKYIHGFEGIFLNEKSELFLGKNDVLVITSSKDYYSNQLLLGHKDFSNFVTYPVIKTSSKKQKLIEFFNINNIDCSNVIAFGDDEKDANVYSELGLKFYIVPNIVGYSCSDEIIKIANESVNNFRNNYLYDYKKMDSKEEKTYGFYSYYLDGVIIYYKNYNVTIYQDCQGHMHGSNNCPSQGFRVPIHNFNNYELGKSNKHYTLESRKEEFANEFDDLLYNDNIIIAKVPSHDELELNKEKPMSKILQILLEKHKNCINGLNLLLRNTITEESKNKGNNRTIWDHLETIYVNCDKKFLEDKTVYLFDDIFTSGTSLMACSELLYRSGAGHVVCFCIARTCGDGKYAPVEIK